MVLATKFSLVPYILLVAALQVSQVSRTQAAGPSHANSICLQIANAVSNNTNVYFPGEPNYGHDIAHYAGSSTQESLCKPPSGVFDQFLSIPALQSNVSTRSLLSLIQSVGSGAPPVRRGVYGAAPIRHNSHNVANAVLNEIHTLSTKLAQKSVTEILCAFEPFLPTVLSHNNLSTAYPHSRDTVYLPMNIWFQWNDTKDDAVMTSAARQTTNNILEAAKRDGQDLRKASAYPNYAIWGTKLEDMYGGNVPKLKSLKRRVDPKNIMGLAGGWKF